MQKLIKYSIVQRCTSGTGLFSRRNMIIETGPDDSTPLNSPVEVQSNYNYNNFDYISGSIK
jgi:hypothetical protein